MLYATSKWSFVGQRQKNEYEKNTIEPNTGTPRATAQIAQKNKRWAANDLQEKMAMSAMSFANQNVSTDFRRKKICDKAESDGIDPNCEPWDTFFYFNGNAIGTQAYFSKGH